MYTLMLCILVHIFNFISITVFLPFGDSCIMSCKKSSLRTLKVSVESLLYKDMRDKAVCLGIFQQVQEVNFRCPSNK